MPVLSHLAIRALLPHRHPMLLVDTVLALDPGRSIVAVKCVTGNEPCYAGLADDATARDSAYPPTLIVESFSQAGVLLWASGSAAAAADSVLMFGVARECVFEGDVQPGDTMEHRITVERAASDSFFFSGETWVGERRVARLGWLGAVIRPAAVVGA